MSKQAKTVSAVNRLAGGFYTMPDSFRDTMTRKHLQETLLATGGWVMACGQVYDIKSKHIGAGVYEVHLELRK